MVPPACSFCIAVQSHSPLFLLVFIIRVPLSRELRVFFRVLFVYSIAIIFNQNIIFKTTASTVFCSQHICCFTNNINDGNRRNLHIIMPYTCILTSRLQSHTGIEVIPGRFFTHTFHPYADDPVRIFHQLCPQAGRFIERRFSTLVGRQLIIQGRRPCMISIDKKNQKNFNTLSTFQIALERKTHCWQ